MTGLKLVPLLLVAAIIAYLAMLSFLTRHTLIREVGQRELADCPDKPNCVYSGAKDDQHRIDALPLAGGDADSSWNSAVSAIHQAGGNVVVDDGQYCHAVFTSTLFRFKDDVEIRREGDRIAIRSASRAGTSDLGKNRERVERIRSLYLSK